MTCKLYHEDAYLTKFRGRVVNVSSGDPNTVALDRTAFYATGGGQPYDSGKLGGADVLDVWEDGAGTLWHRLSRPLNLGDEVEGEIDWARRFDHMQQHGGEHILAHCVHKMLGGHTIGLHLGAEVSTIDVSMPGGRMHAADEEIWALEEEANQIIQSNAPFRAWFPSREELENLPLRKPPTVSENIRIVSVGDFEYVACGGTHPKSAGEIGILKIVDARPSKGKLRLSFVCGMRGVRDYRARFESAKAAGAALSVPHFEVPQALGRLLDALRQSETELRRMRVQALTEQAEALCQNGQKIGSATLVAERFPQMDGEELRTLAAQIAKGENRVAVLAGVFEQEEKLILAGDASGPEGKISMHQILRGAAGAFGGKGGGRPDFAQGSAPGPETYHAAVAMVKEALEKGL